MFINHLLKNIFRIEILTRIMRLTYYKIFSLRYIKNIAKNRNNIFLIYTMGKVGSASIYETLKYHIPFAKIYHLHYLTDKNIKWREEFKKNKSVTLVEKFVQKKLRKTKKRIKIITVVRDILSRDVSMIFQNLFSFFPSGLENCKDSFTKIDNLYENFDHSLSYGWFDNEFRKFTDIDVYSLSFDKERGYSYYKFDNFDLLIIKLEMLSKVYREAFQDFSGINIENLIKVNETSDRRIAAFYNEYKKHKNISDIKLHELYNSKLMKHFYTDHEIKEFIKKARIA